MNNLSPHVRKHVSEIDDANDETKVNDEVFYANAKNNAVENDDWKDPTGLDNESENVQKVHTDESEEKTENTTEPGRKLNMETYLIIETKEKMLKKKKRILNWLHWMEI